MGDFDYQVNLTFIDPKLTGWSKPEALFAQIGIENVQIGIENVDFTGCPKLVSIAPFIFRKCHCMQSIKFSDSVTKICESAFHECNSLTSLVLPKRLSVVEKGGFAQMRKLRSVVFNGELTSLGERAFQFCPSLNKIDLSICNNS